MFKFTINIPELKDIDNLVSSAARKLVGRLVTKQLPDSEYPEEATEVKMEPEKVSDTISYPLKVVGVSHNNRDGSSRQDIISKLKGNERIYLVFEDDNPKDPHAVAVYIGGKQVGYLAGKSGEYRDSWAIIMRDKIRKGKLVSIDRWERVGGKYLTSKIGVRIFVTNKR